MEIIVTKKNVIEWLKGAVKGFLLMTGALSVLNVICEQALTTL